RRRLPARHALDERHRLLRVAPRARRRQQPRRPRGATMRSRRLRGIAAMVVAIGVVVAANVAAYGHDTQADLSAAHRFTLSPETRALVRAVHAPLRIRAFLAS